MTVTIVGFFSERLFGIVEDTTIGYRKEIASKGRTPGRKTRDLTSPQTSVD
jgi:hypothetical protein